MAGPFDDLIPAGGSQQTPAPDPSTMGYAQPQAAQASPPPYQPPAGLPDASTAAISAKMSYIQQYVAAGRGSYQDGAAAYDAATQPNTGGATFAPGGLPGARPTQAQLDYSQAHPADTTQPKGSSGNPLYGYAGAPSDPAHSVVTTSGGMSVPANQPGGSINMGDPGWMFSDLIPKADAWSDVLHTIPAAAGRAISGIVGLPGTVLDAADHGLDWLGERAGVFSPHQVAAMEQPVAPGMGALGLPTGATVDHALTTAAPALGYTPKTWQGRLTETGVDMAPALIGAPSGIGPKLATYVAPVAASDIAGEAARAFAPQYEQAARMVGGMAGGFGASALPGIAPSGAQKVIRAAAENLTPADIDAIQAGRQSAAAQGVPTTLAEQAAYSAPGRGDAFLPVQRAVEQSRRGGPILAPMMTGRPAAQQAAVGQMLDQISPAPVNPGVLGSQVQQAATGALNGVRQGINASARPLYDASASDLIAPSDYAQLAQHPSWQAALQSLTADPEIGPTLQGYAPNSISVVDAGIKRLRDMASQARGSTMAPGDLQLAASRDQAADLADRIAAASSPAYAAAKQTVAQGRATLLDPLTAAATGALSKTDSVNQQTNALWPTAPLPGQANETGQALGQLNSQDPSLSPALLRSHLEQAAGRTMKQGPNGQAPMNGGGRFVAAVQGNPLQAQGLQAGFASAAPQAMQPHQDLFDALMAASARLPTRPPTPEELGAALSAKSVDGSEAAVAPLVGMEAFHSPIGATAALGGKLAGKVVGAVNSARVSANAKALADALSAPADQTSAVILSARDAADRQSRAQLAAAIAAGTVGAAPQN